MGVALTTGRKPQILENGTCMQQSLRLQGSRLLLLGALEAWTSNPLAAPKFHAPDAPTDGEG